MLQEHTDAYYLELEAMLMAFVDDVRSQCTATEPLPRLRQLAAAHVRWRLHHPEICGSAHSWYDPEGDLTIDEVAAMYADFAAGMVRAPMRVE